MRTPSRTTSRPSHIICPACGAGELWPRGPELASCDFCGLSVKGAIFRTLEEIATLPDVLGRHACEECGHPEMRCLPDGVFHCPACGSEVLPAETPVDPKRRHLGSTSAWNKEGGPHPETQIVMHPQRVRVGDGETETKGDYEGERRG
jgi:ribosomal protein L37AE/L43A